MLCGRLFYVNVDCIHIDSYLIMITTTQIITGELQRGGGTVHDNEDLHIGWE